MTPALWPEDFPVDPFHCSDVLSGSYDVPVEHSNPVILDIGANIGAFTKWAYFRWPNATFHCYEPHPGNFKMLLRTVNELAHPEKITCHKMAVLDKAGEFRLYEGQFNCGEWSLYGDAKTNREKFISVPTLDAKELPHADILKIDTEGGEPFILKRLIEVGRIQEFKAIMLEFHRAGEDKTIPAMLAPHGFTLFSSKPGITESRGELKFLRQSDTISK